MGKIQDDSFEGKQNSESENYSEENKRDPGSKRVQKQKSIEKKQKLTQNQKQLTKKSKKQEQNGNKTSSSHQYDNQMREEIYSPYEFFSDFDDNIQQGIQVKDSQEPSSERSQSQQALNIQHQNQNNILHQHQEDVFQNLLMIFLCFFNSIEQPNGLVFKSDLRKKLMKKYPRMNIQPEHKLFPNLQLKKIKSQIPKNLLVFNKNHHNVNMTEQQFQNYIENDVQKMIDIFDETNSIFCQQVTPELYAILRQLCNIVVRYKNKNKQEMIQKLRQFGVKIAKQQDKAHQYFYFGYQFVTYPKNLSAQELKKEQKKEKNKYALKDKYRITGKQFADLTEKAGLYLQNVISLLECYKTLR